MPTDEEELAGMPLQSDALVELIPPGFNSRKGMSEGGLYMWLCRNPHAVKVSVEEGSRILRGEID